MPPMNAKTRAQIAKLAPNKALRVAYLHGFSWALMAAFIASPANR